MPMTVKVGLSKKIGQPDYGSLGASCEIELELDGTLFFHDPSGVQEKIQHAYLACRQAIDDELGRNAEVPPARMAAQANDRSAQKKPESPTSAANGQTNGHATNGKQRTATASQVRALHAIATRQGFNLTDQLKQRYQVFRAEDLSIGQASRLIDDLNQSSSAAANKPGGQA